MSDAVIQVDPAGSSSPGAEDVESMHSGSHSDRTHPGPNMALQDAVDQELKLPVSPPPPPPPRNVGEPDWRRTKGCWWLVGVGLLFFVADVLNCVAYSFTAPPCYARGLDFCVVHATWIAVAFGTCMVCIRDAHRAGACATLMGLVWVGLSVWGNVYCLSHGEACDLARDRLGVAMILWTNSALLWLALVAGACSVMHMFEPMSPRTYFVFQH